MAAEGRIWAPQLSIFRGHRNNSLHVLLCKNQLSCLTVNDRISEIENKFKGLLSMKVAAPIWVNFPELNLALILLVVLNNPNDYHFGTKTVNGNWPNHGQCMVVLLKLFYVSGYGQPWTLKPEKLLPFSERDLKKYWRIKSLPFWPKWFTNYRYPE